jgi:cysteine desulfurase/selenocysteine lyase
MSTTVGTPPRTARPAPPRLDVRRLRQDFPILRQKIHGKPLVYFDNAASSQKPQVIIDALARYYAQDNSNVHRGIHLLSERATAAYEAARLKVQRFLNATSPEEIIFVRGTTEGINLVAQTFGRQNVRAGDEILISAMEHHSNIVPWQLLCEEKGARLRVIPINDAGELIFEEFEHLLGPRTRLVAVNHISNSLGTINPVRRIIETAHRRNVPVLIDGAQAVPHLPVDVRQLDCDFYTFSGHKVYGPTGIGALYGKAELLNAMPPWQGGGDMIASVTFEKTTFNSLPYKFEAGTPNIAGTIGLGAAVDYVQKVGLEAIAAHEHELLRQATELLRKIPGVRIIGNAARKAGVISFVVENPPISALDLGGELDLEGIAVRTGHHCCQPVMDRYGIPATARASFALYNTAEEVEFFAGVLRKVVAGAAARAKLIALPTMRPEPIYPKPTAPSPQEAADRIVEDFEFLEDWGDRYQYIIDLGRKLPPLPDDFRTEPHRVHGCQSTVFLHTRQKPGTADVLEFLADSDADIVRGLIGLLERVLSGHRAGDLLAFDVEAFFTRLGLNQNLSMGRRNGLAAMVQRIRNSAATLATQSSGPAQMAGPSPN